MTVTVYCDGSGTRGGPAGVGFVAHVGDATVERSLPLPNATNQQAEILAAAYALHETAPAARVVVYSDSEYVVKGATEWLDDWIARGWRTKSGAPVKNQRHWLRLIEARARHGVVEFRWLRGHNGDPGNERADELARAARRQAAA